MRSGPFIPDQQARVLYSMCADDCSLHFDLANLTPKQQADHEANLDLIAMPQIASSYIGKPTDHVAVYDAFNDPAWRDTLEFYNAAHQRMGLDPIPLANFHFYPRERFYEAMAEDLSAGRIDVDLNTLYMISGWNAVLHRNDEALDISRKANSKMQLADDAQRFGIPAPDTKVFHKADLDGPEVAAFFEKHDNTLMLKIKGLAGARNVTVVGSPADALVYLAEFPDDLEVVLQRKLADTYTEMTVDLCVSDLDISIANVRRILFAEGLWVGNLIGPDVALTPAHEDVLIEVGRYVRGLGYTSPEGYNCGIDFFIGNDELLVIEINARWTGGLFPAQMITRLGVQQETTVVFFDRVIREKLPDYLAFQDKHLFGVSNGASNNSFASVPLGFSPFTAEIDGAQYVHVWQMVVGDFEAFKRAKRDSLGEGQLPTAELISLSAT